MAFEQLSNSAVNTLDGAITNVATTLTVTSAVGFPTSGDFRVRIDAEILLVTGVAGLVFTVTRGVEGTGNVSHLDNARIAHVLTAGAIQALRDEDVVILNDGRLTVVSGNPLGALANQSTIYFTPYIGKKISVYNGTRWIPHDFTEISVAVPSTIFRLFDIFVFDNAGTLTLETQDHAQNTAAITAASNASPIVITSTAHGLANGDFVGISGIVGNTAANDIIWQVASVTANTFELLGSAGNGAYVSGGTWYECSGQADSGVTTVDKITVDSVDNTKRYVGSGFTGPTSGQISVTASNLELVNADNQIQSLIAVSDSTTHTYALADFRPWNNDGSLHFHFLRALNVYTTYLGYILANFKSDGFAVSKVDIGRNDLTSSIVTVGISTLVTVNQKLMGFAFQNISTNFNLDGPTEGHDGSGTATFNTILLRVVVQQ